MGILAVGAAWAFPRDWTESDDALNGIWEVHYQVEGHDDVFEMLVIANWAISLTTVSLSRDHPETAHDERLNNAAMALTGLHDEEKDERGAWHLTIQKLGTDEPMFPDTHVIATRVDATTLQVEYISGERLAATKRGETLPPLPLGRRPEVLTYKLRSPGVP